MSNRSITQSIHPPLPDGQRLPQLLVQQQDVDSLLDGLNARIGDVILEDDRECLGVKRRGGKARGIWELAAR